MNVKKGQELELAVGDIAFGGRGLARIDGLAVFVDQAVPGDVVRARIFKKKKNYAEARTLEVISGSPHRVAAPCRYSGYCGGCKWQFLDYGQQLVYKRRHVLESIEHIGLIRNPVVHGTLASPHVFHYRNKMEFSCSDRRWLLPEEMQAEDVERGIAVGLHVPGTFHKVLDTRECLLQPDLGNLILDRIRQYIKDSGAPVYGLKSHQGFWRFVMLRHSRALDRWLVNLITAAEEQQVVQPLAEALEAEFPQIVGVVNNITARRAGIAVGEIEIPLIGRSVLTDRIGRFSFDISANSFFQTNSAGAEMLYRTVRNYAEPRGGETVVDLYSGTGTIAIWLSDAVGSVIGFEIADTAVADADANCRKNGVDNCRFVAGDLRNSLAVLTRSPHVMVIDPPRTGMHKDVVQQVLAMAPQRIVYVSCNPATLARDLGMMKEQYRIVEVQPVDMFPHTFHIEAVVKLERRKGAGQ